MIYLVRHTQYENPNEIIPGRLPVSLTEAGENQAQRLSKFFENKNITKIFSSPVKRCIETSEIISNSKTPIELDIRLAEVLSALQGSSGENWREILYSNQKTLGGESPQDIYNRVSNFWENIQFNTDKNYIVCSHGDPLLFLYLYLNSEGPWLDLSSNEPEGYQAKVSVRIVLDSKENKIIDYIKNENLTV